MIGYGSECGPQVSTVFQVTWCETELNRAVVRIKVVTVRVWGTGEGRGHWIGCRASEQGCLLSRSKQGLSDKL